MYNWAHILFQILVIDQQTLIRLIFVRLVLQRLVPVLLRLRVKGAGDELPHVGPDGPGDLALADSSESLRIGLGPTCAAQHVHWAAVLEELDGLLLLAMPRHMAGLAAVEAQALRGLEQGLLAVEGGVRLSAVAALQRPLLLSGRLSSSASLEIPCSSLGPLNDGEDLFSELRSELRELQELGIVLLELARVLLVAAVFQAVRAGVAAAVQNEGRLCSDVMLEGLMAPAPSP